MSKEAEKFKSLPVKPATHKKIKAIHAKTQLPLYAIVDQAIDAFIKQGAKP